MTIVTYSAAQANHAGTGTAFDHGNALNSDEIPLHHPLDEAMPGKKTFAIGGDRRADTGIDKPRRRHICSVASPLSLNGAHEGMTPLNVSDNNLGRHLK
ncbi:hypothetical protein ACIBQ1_23920 [Nonomuraea sp. NPDC050153]|uniref:hypothetical protein n=1 Tax=Nonomuraea sp. NPDC050153 TaxID=3364359 RepID=UPI0037AF7979